MADNIPNSDPKPGQGKSSQPNNYYLPVVTGITALIAFIFVVYLSEGVLQVNLNLNETLYAIAMGLLGSSLYLLYNLIGVVAEQRFRTDELEKNFSRLLVGPVAGWLVYFMLVSNTEVSGNLESSQTRFTTGAIQIWLPFLSGYSSDLMVGFINQMIRAVKYTLGIEPMPEKSIKKEKKEDPVSDQLLREAQQT